MRKEWQAKPSMKALVDADDTVRELRTVLAQVGVKLPSLCLDPVMMAREEPIPLVELGRCTPDVARHLIAALQRGQNAGTETGSARTASGSDTA